jgi:formamidopyrimidine-DNA glycosylase
MPELPEVETIKSQLSNFLPLEIKCITFSDKTTRLIKQKDFTPKSGETITEFSRKGKFLIFRFANLNHYIISHLGMSGSWRISDSKLDEVSGKHAHIIIETDKKVLSYVDPRRFGHIYFLNKKNFEQKISSYPMDISEPGFDANHIKSIFDKYPNKVLKPFLLDQKNFSGVGNYIASEICARAKLLPTRIVKTLTKKDCLNIKAAIDLIIFGAVKTQGTTFGGGYRDAFGEKGEGVQHLVVFHQVICQMCKKTKVIKTVLAGRGTYHCPHCQQ